MKIPEIPYIPAGAARDAVAAHVAATATEASQWVLGTCWGKNGDDVIGAADCVASDAWEGEYQREAPTTVIAHLMAIADAIKAAPAFTAAAAEADAVAESERRAREEAAAARAAAIERTTGGLDEESAVALGIRQCPDRRRDTFVPTVEEDGSLRGIVVARTGTDYVLTWSAGEDGWTVTRCRDDGAPDTFGWAHGTDFSGGSW